MSEIRNTIVGEVIARRAAVATLGFDQLDAADARRLIAVTASLGQVGNSLELLHLAGIITRSDELDDLVADLVDLAAYAVGWAERLDSLR